MAHKIKAQVFVILCLRRPIYRHCTCIINICEDDLMAWWWGERSQKWNSDVLVFGRMELYLELNCIFYSNIMYTKNYIRQL